MNETNNIDYISTYHFIKILVSSGKAFFFHMFKPKILFLDHFSMGSIRMDHYCPIHRLVQYSLTFLLFMGILSVGCTQLCSGSGAPKKGISRNLQFCGFINISLDHERDKKTCIKMFFRA